MLGFLLLGAMTGLALAEPAVSSQTDAALAASAKDWVPDDSLGDVRFLTLYSQVKFAPLLAMLPKSVPAEKAARLKDLIAEREIRFAHGKADALKAGVPLPEYLNAQAALIKQKITTEVGPDVAALVDDYVQTLPQRRLVNELNQILVYRRQAMNPEQMERLTRLIHGTDVNLTAKPGSEAELDAFMAHKNAARDKILATASAYLDAGQLEVLRLALDLPIAQLNWQRNQILGLPRK
ncbi:MAG: hypothetical protein JSS11_16880 [Verrucomicrobia bacterium]|nr:hypothetical protein [Verrucomicrobiota bacterium]